MVELQSCGDNKNLSLELVPAEATFWKWQMTVSKDLKPLRCICQRPIENGNHFSDFVDDNTELLNGKISDTREYWQTT